MKFEMDEKEKALADAFIKEHGCTWKTTKNGRPYFGATNVHGCHLEIQSSTLFGSSLVIKCICGEAKMIDTDGIADMEAEFEVMDRLREQRRLRNAEKKAKEEK